MAAVTEAARAIDDLLTEEFERTNGLTGDKKILWEASVPILLSYHLEDDQETPSETPNNLGGDRALVFHVCAWRPWRVGSFIVIDECRWAARRQGGPPLAADATRWW